EIERLAQRLSRCARLASPPQDGADLHQGTGVFVRCGDVLVDRSRLLESLEISPTDSRESTSTQAGGDESRLPECLRAVKRAIGDPLSFVPTAGLQQRGNERACPERMK